jgi:transcription elongation factor GreA
MKESGGGDSMAKNEVLLTKEGVLELENTLEYLKTVRRLEIAEQIKQARAFGDISENAEYDEAKNEQARIEGEIAHIENTLRNARVIDDDEIDTGVVNVGTTVTVYDLDYDEELVYTIVGSTEANPAMNRISNESPVGVALLGQHIGSEVSVNVPGGVVRYRITNISR